jgi:hypothetical protein
VRTYASPGREPWATHRPPPFLRLTYIPHPPPPPLRPNGAPECSDGWSDAALSIAQPVEPGPISALPQRGKGNPTHPRHTQPPHHHSDISSLHHRDPRTPLHSTPTPTTPHPIHRAPTAPTYALWPSSHTKGVAEPLPQPAPAHLTGLSQTEAIHRGTRRANRRHARRTQTTALMERKTRPLFLSKLALPSVPCVPSALSRRGIPRTREQRSPSGRSHQRASPLDHGWSSSCREHRER